MNPSYGVIHLQKLTFINGVSKEMHRSEVWSPPPISVLLLREPLRRHIDLSHGGLHLQKLVFIK